VKAYYSGQKMLSQILFFETMQLLTSTKPILKEAFINCTQNNEIVKGNYIFCLVLND
jgi:hypothetical protein